MALVNKMKVKYDIFHTQTMPDKILLSYRYAFRVIKTSEKLISWTMKCYEWIERFMQDSELFSHYANGMVRVHCSHRLMYHRNMLLFFPIHSQHE